MRDPARQALRRHRAERLGQEHARVRRRLRRGAAPLPGDADAVRAPVPADAAAARRRLASPACRRRSRSSSARRAAARTRTVATVTEIAHYLRLLYAKVGDAALPEVRRAGRAELARRAVRARSRALRRRQAHALRAGRRARARARTSTSSRGASRAGRRDARASTARSSPIDPPPKLAKTKEHTIDLIVYYGKLADARSRRRSTARSRGAQARSASPRRADAKAAPEPSRSSRPRARARAAAPACRSSIRAGSRSTPSRASARRARARASRAGPTALDEDEPPTRRAATCDGSRLAPLSRARVRLAGETYRERHGALGGERARARADAGASTGNDALIAKAPHARAPAPARVRRARSASATSRSIAPRRRSRAARCSASASPRSSAAGSPARSTCSTSRPSACTRATRGASSANLRAARRHGLAPCSSSSTTPRRSAPPITSSTSGPAAAATAGTSSPRDPPAQVLADPRSPTARALAASRAASSAPKRPMADAWIELTGARAQQPAATSTFRVPVGRMCVVAGVSGSGKSTLVRHVFYPGAAAARSASSRPSRARTTRSRGTKVVERALAVDQSPIGRTPRSVPATFLGVWDEMRKLFAVARPRRRSRGYGPARFSFNTPPRAAAARRATGRASSSHEMSFLPDVVDALRGVRRQRASSRRRSTCATSGLSIGDVLRPHRRGGGAASSRTTRRSRARSRRCADLGVGYVQLGQGSQHALRRRGAAPQARRRAHRGRRATSRRVYVLDEPTTGLHLADVRAPRSACSIGSSSAATRCVVIEHHPDVIASADWVVELGPEAGEGGGRVVFEGEPRKLARARTATGKVMSSLALQI